MEDRYGFSLLHTFPQSWSILLTVFLFSFLLIGALYVLARRYELMMPRVRTRDVHTTRKPRVGGLGMWLVLTTSLLVLSHTGTLLNFTGARYWELAKVVWGILAALVILLVFGLLDDFFSLKPQYQLLGQLLAATALILGGLQVEFIRLPFDKVLYLNTVVWHLPAWLGGNIFAWSALFTYVWVIIMINAMNFFDGLDGLAGSVGLTAAFVLLLVSLRIGFLGAATLSLVLLGTAAGFLPWNWHPSKLFMGTVGSQTLGLFLAVIAIISGAKVATAILVLGIPLFDAFVVIGRRLLAGQSPFKADQRHLHHRLLKIGLSTPMVVVIINLVVIVFGLLALRTQQTNTKGLLTLTLALLMALFIFITYLLERRALRK